MSPSNTSKPLKVVVIGAGVAGLAVAYGLAQPRVAGRFKVRVFEKRSGYPVHLTPPGQAALKSLLSPTDQYLLFLARQAIPARHDGITVLNSECKRIWHMLRGPFESSLVERGDLLRILRDQVRGIEYDREVISVQEKLGAGATVTLSGGETVHADVLVGCDGMFSATRVALHATDHFRPVPWVTCNFHLSSSIFQELGADPNGINLFYGTGWSSTITPIADGAYVALTLPAPIKDIDSALARLPDSPLLRLIRADENLEDGRAFPLHSATTTQVGKGRVILIGDAAHGMTPFVGAGASMALSDAAKLVKVLTGHGDLDNGLSAFHLDVKKRADPMIRLSDSAGEAYFAFSAVYKGIEDKAAEEGKAGQGQTIAGE